MHIAFVISSLAAGGSGDVYLALARGMVARGHRVDLVLFHGHFHYKTGVPDSAKLFVVDDSPDSITKNNPAYPNLRNRIQPVRPYSGRLDWFRLARALNWHPYVLPTPSKLRDARGLAGYVEEQHPDIILPTLPRSIVSTLLAGHLIAPLPPAVPVIQGMIEKNRKHKKIRYRALFPDAAQVVAVSEGVADNIHTEIGIPQAKITAIYNPVVPPELDALKSQIPDHPWFVDGGAPIILACGRLIELKGFRMLINSFARLSKKRDYRLIILGKGPQREELEGLIIALGLEQKVSLPGWVDNPYSFMSRASLFVLSSRTEGLPTVLIQALACGCPCVSTDCPSGPAEILQDGSFGELVKVGDEVAFAGAMLRVLDNRPSKQKLLRRGRFFEVERSVEIYEELLMRIMREHETGII